MTKTILTVFFYRDTVYMRSNRVTCPWHRWTSPAL